NFTENISGENISSLVQPNKLKPVIDYEYNNLEFEYSSPYFIAPISTLYSYKLEGFDEDWSYWTDGTKKEYTNLPENEYVFRVKAKNIYGFESKIATYQFCILPPWYRVWWVYTLYVIFAMIFIWQIVRISVKRHVKAKRLLEEIVKERTAEIIKQKEEIETVAKELEIANMAKDKLFSVIAHDLKSPFNVIIGYTEILDDGYDDFDDDEIKQFISEIGKSSKSVYALLENLLLWALAQRDKIEIEKQNTNLKQLVVDATSTYLINAQNKEITFTNSVSDNISVSVDIQIIKTVIGNLFSNAIKFTPDKGAITIEATVVDDFVQVKVSDNGVGIPSEVLSKIFRFDEKHSTLGTNKEKGTGFGLSLCKEFVEKNGGEIWVESEQNVGSQFYFTVSLSISNTN
ncbi:MAG: ATP-binding protein, partial [Bacteroidota bacterium]|nr:ATP-binding protein [Bacteroidota bacterium]